jgi:two-component system, NtrC family, response regulator AtoC
LSTILVCDDEELIRWSLEAHLQEAGYTVVQASNGQECIEAVGKHAPSLVIMDLQMPVRDGLSALRELRSSGAEVPVVVLTAHGGVDSAIEATQLGASAFLSKPFDVREVALTVKKVLEQDRLKREVHYLRRRERDGYGDFIGTHAVLQPLYETLRRLEEADAPTVLLIGESGTGKDVLARTIHSRGPRKDRPFIAVDCAALPEALIESELFGHERGAFTDAKTAKSGLFEIAEKGVAFLDEIGELPIGTQSKLLRALEDRTFRRVGGTRRFPMDVGIVAATNRNLKEEVSKGTFREDLYFRLDVIQLRVPALRERVSDVPLLVGHFMERFNRQFGRHIEGVDGEAMKLLQQHRWPGNVRELRNLVERLVLLGPDDVIRPQHLPPEIRFSRSGGQAIAGCPFELPDDGVDLEAVERGLIQQALTRAAGNQSAAARLLGISRYALRYRMEKFELG